MVKDVTMKYSSHPKQKVPMQYIFLCSKKGYFKLLPALGFQFNVGFES